MSTSCEQYETYTFKVDSRGAPSNNSFVGYVNIPLRNVVKAELLSASIASNSATTAVLYVYVDELVSKFNDKSDVQTVISVAGNTSNIGPNPTSTTSNVAQLRTALVAYPTDQVNARSVFTTSSFWNTEVEYIEPIRQIQHLTVTILKDDGNLPSLSEATYLTIRFTCSKPNRCLY